MNDLNKGAYRWMVYKEGDSWLGVALEFNIVIDGDDPSLVAIELQEAVRGYIESTLKMENGFRKEQVVGLLNQTSDDEYETKWVNAMQLNVQPQGSVPSPFTSDIYSVGRSSLTI